MVKSSTIRIIFSLAVTRGWDVQQVDVNNAFLNGNLHETVLMPQPKGFEDPSRPNFVCKLNRALYGLKQAPRDWFHMFRQTLIQWGFHNSVSDSSLFYSHTNGEVIFFIFYVDDILITGNNSTAIHNLICDLHSTFALKTLSSVNYFSGFKVLYTHSLLHLRQTKYASDLLHKTNMINAKPCSTPMASTHKLSLNDSPPFPQPSLYRSTIGALQYLTHTRPGISYAVNAPTTAHWVSYKRIL